MAAKKIKGITIEIGGDTSGFQKSLSAVDKSLRNTQNQLKQVDKALKLDPGNTDLLKRKQDLLNKTYEDTTKRLQELKTARDKAMDPTTIQANIDKANQAIEKQEEKIRKANEALKEVEKGSLEYNQLQASIERANKAIDEEKERLQAINDNSQVDALNAEIYETEVALKQAKKAVDDFGSVIGQQMKVAGEKVSDIGSKVKNVGEDMTKYITVPIAGLAGASVASFNEVDSAMDSLITKTGATGDAFAEMQGIVENIATTMPVSIEDAANAVAEVNTRFGYTGSQLDEVSREFLKFARINGTDITSAIDTSQKAMDAFGLSAEDTVGALNVLNKVGQETGADINKLSSDLVSNAAVFQELGMGYTDAANLLGRLEKSGVDASTVLSGLSKAQVSAIKNGTTFEQELTSALTNSENAIDTFGTKAGAKLFQAFQNGTLSLEDFEAKGLNLSSAFGSVSNTFEATIDPLDKLQSILNELKLIGSDFVESSGPMLVDILKTVSDLTHDLSEGWNSLTDEQKENALKIVAIVAALGPLITALGSVITAVGTIMQAAPAIGGAITTISELLSGPVGWIALLTTGIVGLIALWPKLDKAAEDAAESFQLWLGDTTLAVGTAISDWWDDITGFFGDIVGYIKKIKIPLPHFQVSGSLNPADWFSQGMPKFNVEWYKKAQNTPYFFNTPQIVGVGDVPEVIIGADAFRRMQAGTTVINNTINATINNDADVEMLANRVSEKIQSDIDRQNAGWR